MAQHAFLGKNRLCYTDVTDFTAFQGVGDYPFYKRPTPIENIVKTKIDANYQHFLATPDYLEDDDQIAWHVAKTQNPPERLSELTAHRRTHYEDIKAQTLAHYREVAAQLSGQDQKMFSKIIDHADDNAFYCADDKVFLVSWGMQLDTNKHEAIGAVLHEYQPREQQRITFEAGAHGDIPKRTEQSFTLRKGAQLTAKDLPQLHCHQGWEFISWSPEPVGAVVDGDLTFTANYRELAPPTPTPTPPPTPIAEETAPEATQPTAENLAEEQVLATEPETVLETRLVEKKDPWYKRFWQWLKRRWWWLLLLLLTLFLLPWLLDACRSCHGFGAENGVRRSDSITTPDGRRIDNNGNPRPITDDQGTLPSDTIIGAAPVMGEGGTPPPTADGPDGTTVIANRLLLFMENDNGDIDALARDFKKLYPSEAYAIIGADREAKVIAIQVPENERNTLRERLPQQLSQHHLLVFDDQLYTTEQSNTNNSASAPKGWHLSATGVQKGWQYSRGKKEVKVAIVDDGIQATHPMFKGRIVEAYNVFTQDNRLSTGIGHGTHVAALAAGSADFVQQGAAGVAPACSIMPIQISDNGHIPLSAMVAGVMYALHHNADVVNISIGTSLKSLANLSPEQQAEAARKLFRNEAILWNRIAQLAGKKNCILVFAAGNDDVLAFIEPQNRTAAALTVAAVTPQQQACNFSNYGQGTDISAPGLGIYSAVPNSAFAALSGTSMATPIVTGTIALMKSLKKNITIAQVRNVLQRTGSPVQGNIPPMLQVDKALDAVKRGDFSPPNDAATTSPGGGNTAPSSPSEGNNAAPSSPSGGNTAPTQPANGANPQQREDILRKIREQEERIRQSQTIIEQLRRLL